MKKSILLLSIISLLLFNLSCSNDDDKNKEDETAENAITADDAKNLVYSFKRVDDIFDLIIGYGFNEVDDNDAANSSLPNCVIYDENINGSNIEIFWNFANSGCQLSNNITYTGAITINRNYGENETAFSGSATFNNLYVNDTHISGNINFETFFDSDIESSFTVDLNLELPSGKNVNITGTFVRNWIEGDDTNLRFDDEFLLRADAIIKIDNTEYHSLISDGITRRVSCDYFVAGDIEILYDDNNTSIDLGDGDCNDMAILYDELHVEYATITLMP